MARRYFFVAVVLATIRLSTALSVIAQGPEEVYVKEEWAGNEAGTKVQPYNTLKEGIAYARSRPDGGFVYAYKGKDKDGNDVWEYEGYYPCVVACREGVPLPTLTLYALLAVLAVVLLLWGWRLRRRAHRL
jgi:hypothetical protein